MKQILFIITIVCTTTAMAQVGAKGTPAKYEAANWKTLLLDNVQDITVNPPPTIAQSKVELKSIKNRMAEVDEAKMRTIQYWNAGAPAYRWNQIAPQFAQ